jgi:hypothetical protein
LDAVTTSWGFVAGKSVVQAGADLIGLIAAWGDEHPADGAEQIAERDDADEREHPAVDRSDQLAVCERGVRGVLGFEVLPGRAVG